MFKKILLGLLAAAIACSLAHSGYAFGKYLADKDKAGASRQALRDTAAG